MTSGNEPRPATVHADRASCRLSPHTTPTDDWTLACEPLDAAAVSAAEQSTFAVSAAEQSTFAVSAAEQSTFAVSAAE